MKSSDHSVQALGFHLFRCGTKASSLLMGNQMHRSFSTSFSEATLPIVNVHAIISLHTVDGYFKNFEETSIIADYH